MNALATHRMGVIIGLAVAAATTLWWLGSMRLTLVRNADTARAASDALYALVLVRGMVLAVLSVRVGALQGWRAAVAIGLGVITPSWPVMLLAWSASTAAFASLMMAEALLVGAGVVLSVIGATLRPWLRRPELATIVGTAIAVTLTAIGFYQSSWLLVLFPNHR